MIFEHCSEKQKILSEFFFFFVKLLKNYSTSDWLLNGSKILNFTEQLIQFFAIVSGFWVSVYRIMQIELKIFFFFRWAQNFKVILNNNVLKLLF